MNFFSKTYAQLISTPKNIGATLSYSTYHLFLQNGEKIRELNKSDLDLIFKTQTDRYIAAYVDGYAVFLEYKNARFSFTSENVVSLNKFINFLEEKCSKTTCDYNKTLNIYEYDSRVAIKDVIVGKIKSELTMDHFVSRHKLLIIKKLDALVNNTLFKDIPYFENNLGILLHGKQGSGKSLLMTVVANYLNKSIYEINFAKIKTKSAFRNIVNNTNNDKYIYCFDEFDYLLAEFLNDSTDSFNSNINTKITALSAQMSAVSNNPELVKQLSEQMKSLMEADSSDVLTYPFLLSELSGINSCKNRVIIATTNFINKISGSLTRPGRFDLVLNLDCFNREEICELLIKLFPNSLTDAQKAKIERAPFMENKFTPAEIIFARSTYDTVEDMIKFLST